MPGTERDWADLDVPGSFERCVRGSIGELYAFAGLLCGTDRDAAERLVTGVYASLRHAVDGGLTDSVSLGALRSAVRRRWVDDRRIGLLAQVEEARRDARPADTLGELRELERAVLVLHHVNRMPVDRIAEELGIPDGRVEQIETSARRRLHGDGEPARRWIRRYYGDSVHVRPDLADSILGHRPLTRRTVVEAPEPEPEPEPDAGGPPTMAVPIHVVLADHDDVVDRSHDEPDEPDAPTVQIAGDDELEPPDTDDTDDTGDHDTGPGRETRPVDAVAVPVRAATPRPVDTVETVDTVEHEGGRRRTAVVAGVVLVGALIAALVLWVGSRGDDESAARPSAAPLASDDSSDDSSPDSTAGSSTEPTVAVVPQGDTTVALGGTTAPSTPAAVGAGRFDPACAERPVAEAEPAALDEAAVAALGPLGAAPNLVIDLPAALTDAGPGDATASVLRVPGGVLVTARAGEVAGESMVARLDADGTVRWVRCFTGIASVRGVAGTPLADAVAIQVAGAGTAWQELSLVDGSLGADVAEPPLPPTLATGDPVPWPDPAIATLPGEGFTAGGTNGVTIVLGCATLAADGVSCDQVVLRGYNTADNTLLWSRDGVSDVAIVRDGYAVIAYGTPGNAPWYMVSAADGAAIDGQVWADPATFATAAGTSSPTSWIEVAGGVVARGDAGAVSIWYPVAADVGTASVSLP